jgi:hypothetical protein
MAAANRALSYVAGHSTNAIIYHASDMILFSRVDASYLSRSASCSLCRWCLLFPRQSQPAPQNQMALYTSSRLSFLVSSQAPGKPNTLLSALFAGGQYVVSLRNILTDLGHPQPPTIIMCDNTCAIGIANDSIKQKRSKAIDMRFHWIRDRIRQEGQFIISCIKKELNMADYFTKNLEPTRHNLFTPFMVKPTI